MIRNIKQFLFIAGLLIIAAGAQPVGAAFWSWSTTASNNATADPSINWAEGMAPSAVNDSARAMMAVLAAFRIDNGGSLITGGTSTAYTLTTSQPFASTADLEGQSIAFIVTPTNGVAPTLNVNGIGAIPLVTEAGVPVAAGSLHDGRIYHATYRGANNVFRVHDVIDDAFNVPLGAILWSTAPTAPNANFVAPSGQCLSTTTYAAYWVQQGSPASGACPGGQFAIIDMRGRVAAALDTLNASAAGRLTSAATGCGTAMTSIGAVCANGVQSYSLTLAQLPTGITSTGSTSNTITVTGPISGGLMSRSIIGGGSSENYTPGSQNFNNTNVAQFSGSNSITANVTSSNTTGTAHPVVPPTIGLIPYLRVL